MFGIYFLKFTEAARTTLPLAKKLINQHYVLTHKNVFFVMTSKPVPGLKSTYIHTPNIEGQTSKGQYVIEHMHVYNPKIHILEYSAKGMSYLAEHQEKFQQVLEALKNLPQ